ncbi:MAG: aldehyde dehydrogenase family protein [Pseudomonadota bacterium]
MQHTQQFYIDGQWVEPRSDQRLDVVNPATESTIATIAMGNLDDVDAAIAAARRAFPDYSQTTREERLALLDKIINAFQARMPEIAEAISQEMGAPLHKLALPAQAGAMLGQLKVTAKILKDYQFYEDVGTTRNQREPIGVVGMITPWNWPIHQIGCKVAPALAAGCTMVLKPSELAPLSALIFADILDQAGVPAGVFNLVNGDGPTVGARLSSHPDIDFVSFTGSTRAGVQVSTAAAPTVKKVGLELGGKSANVLLEDADFESAVANGMGSMLMNSGQNCNAPSRLLVPRARLAEVEALAAKVAASAVIGAPDDESTTMGPLANKPQFEKVQSLINTGIESGAKLVCGGSGRPEGCETGYFVRPTVFSDVDNHMQIAREEIFGPVLCIIPYDTEAQAIDIANDTEYGLSGYVSSADMQRAQAVASKLRSGNVHVNGASGNYTGAFGGYKKSGLGREWGVFGFEEYLEIKSIFGFQSKAS